MDLKSRLEYFNPRAPCGARRSNSLSAMAISTFQSTRPMRGATILHEDCKGTDFISIHAPHAGRDACRCATGRTRTISIHAPHAGRDLNKARRLVRWQLISIHAPHAGRDLLSHSGVACACRFQSTRPMRGATVSALAYDLYLIISIHAPHAGRDPRRVCRSIGTGPFQSTRPMRGATKQKGNGYLIDDISIHAPHAGRDCRPGALPICTPYFNPRAPCGARPRTKLPNVPKPKFQSTRPMRGAT